MAFCNVCHNMFDNVDGTCPHCGAEYTGAEGEDRSHEDLFKEATDRIKAGQVADAKGLLTQAIKQDEQNGRYHFFLGSVLYKMGQHREAFSAWQRADRLMPHVDRIHKCLVAARQRIAEEEK